MTTPMDLPEVEELLGAYALDAVDADERAAVEAHLADCPRCRDEMAGHLEVAALLAQGGAPAPDGLWDRIADALEADPPPLRVAVDDADARIVPIGRARAGRASRRPARAVLAVAAAGVVALVGVGAVVAVTRDEPVQVAAPDLAQVAGEAMADPANARVALTRPEGSPGEPLTATVVVTPDGEGFLFTPDLPALGPDRTYQLWGVVGEQAISLGVLGPDPSLSPFHVDANVPVSAYAITEEVAGGVITSQADPTLVGAV